MSNLFSNHVLNVAVLSWILAQIIKIIIHISKYKTFKPNLIFASGGMPSSHSSAVTGLTTAVAYTSGFNSTAFAISFILACIVMYDAAGVRLAVGTIGKILNDMFHNKDVTYEKLNELVGHTPFQVIAGAILGITFGCFYF